MPDPSPARPPLQARSRRTLGLIIETSRALIAERGREGLTVQEVVARSRVSVGAFYARFSGRDELLRYLDDDLAARERDRWAGELSRRAGADAGLEARIRAVVGLLLGSSADLPGQSHEHLRAIAAGAVLGGDSGEILHPDPAAAVDLVYGATLGALRHRPTGWTDQRLADEVVRMWMGYLAGSGEVDGRGPGSVDFFDVWA